MGANLAGGTGAASLWTASGYHVQTMDQATEPPKHLDLTKDRGLTVHWRDGRISFYPVKYLRKMSPSADAMQLREQMQANPLTVLPASAEGQDEPLTATGVEMVGHYAVKITFSDGHDTGLYSWRYLREIDPNTPPNLN